MCPCTVTGDTSGVAVTLWFCTDCTVADCKIDVGGVAGFSPINCTFSGNTITGSTRNAISVTVLSGVTASGNKYIGNTIRNCQRIGIEEFPNGNAAMCTGALIDSNTIENCTGIGISATGIDPVITRNILKNNPWGVEVTGAKASVQSNKISSTTNTGNGIVIYGRNDSIAQQANISSNELTGLANGIYLHAPTTDSVLRNATIATNIITNCSEVGLNAAAVTCQGVTAKTNTVTLTAPSILGKNRYGIRTGAGLFLDGNKVTYKISSQGPAPDMPIHLVGNNVTLANTVVDGGGRTKAKNLVPSSAVKPARTYLGWRYRLNRYLNGATIDKLGTVFLEDTDFRS